MTQSVNSYPKVGNNSYVLVRVVFTSFICMFIYVWLIVLCLNIYISMILFVYLLLQIDIYTNKQMEIFREREIKREKERNFSDFITVKFLQSLRRILIVASMICFYSLATHCHISAAHWRFYIQRCIIITRDSYYCGKSSGFNTTIQRKMLWRIYDILSTDIRKKNNIIKNNSHCTSYNILRDCLQVFKSKLK